MNYIYAIVTFFVVPIVIL